MAYFPELLLNEIGINEKIDTSRNPLPVSIQRKKLRLPTLPESEIVRHYTHLSQMNYGIDTGMYPLGSCTMKYNPKISEEISNWDVVTQVHPYQDDTTIQGSLQVMFELEKLLCVITGMDAFTLQPAAGAHGELLGMLIAQAYHRENGEKRDEVIISDSAHGTNPASAKMAGYTVIEIPSHEGIVDLDALRSVLSTKTAAFMLTNPNTLGIFEKDILEISREVKKVGSLLYYDGANMNAIMGKARPGDMGFDIVHLNLHKTFAAPHGGGGPGAGPVGVTKVLEKFLPIPRIMWDNKYFFSYDHSESLGKISHFYGNFPVLLKAYIYIIMNGGDGLTRITEQAVRNANYMLDGLKNSDYLIPFGKKRMHEFVASAIKLKREKGIRALDIAKRLMDYGFHPPTIYFPLIVDEALMIEPTETETKKSLDDYIDALINISKEDPSIVKTAPHHTSFQRIDEVEATKNAIHSWKEISRLSISK